MSLTASSLPRYADGLSSAVARPQTSAFGQDAYLTISLKAAALIQSLAENQPFVDGNKRIAWICGKVFPQFHGLTIHATVEEGTDLFLNRIANGMTVPELADWIDRQMSAMFNIGSDDDAESAGIEV